MKRICRIILVVFLMCILSNVSNAAFEVDNSITPTAVKVGDIVTYTIIANESVVATNFDISYESDKFELVGSDTAGLNVAEKNGKIACIYADISGTGTKEFKIKFKAIDETNNATFSVDNHKFRVQNMDESYTDVVTNPISKVNVSNTPNNDSNSNNKQENTPDDDSSGNDQQGNNSNNGSSSNDKQENTQNKPSTNNQQTNKENTVKGPDKTISTQKLPKTGENSFLFFMICVTIVFAIILKIKYKKMKDIFKAGGIMLFAITFIPAMMYTTEVNASSATLEVKFYNDLIPGKNSALIINETGKTELTKAEVMNLDNNITDITNLDGTSLNESDNVKTKDIIKVDNGDSYTVIIFGDSNGDGIMCDTDDIMNIINDYLGKNEVKDEERIAANLENRDELLDTDDIMIMINTYLGKDTKIVANIPEGNIDITTQGVKFAKVSMAAEHVLALDKQGNIWTWGKYAEHKVANEPIKLETTVKFKDISADTNANSGDYEDYNLLIDEAGNIWSWGDNRWGNLGNGSMQDSDEPVQITTGTKFESVIAAGNTGIALDEEGNIWTWGAYSYKLITGRITDESGVALNKLQPTQATSGIKYTSISANYSNAAAIDEDGNIWIWGNDGYLKLWWDGTMDGNMIVGGHISEPKQFTTGTRFTKVYTSQYTLFAIDEEKNLWVMGDNEYYQLMGLSNSTKTLQKLDNSTKYIGAELANGDTFVIDKDGNIWGCGFNQCGILCNGTEEKVKIPYQITSGNKFVQIDIEHDHFAVQEVIALDEDGNIWEWGETVNGYKEKPTLLVINEPEEEKPEDLVDNTGKLLKDVAKIGDYIKYPKEYTNVKNTIISSNSVQNKNDDSYKPNGTGWRVLSNQNEIVKIMTVGCPETYIYSEQTVNYITNTSNFTKYVDSNYAVSAIGAPTEDEVTNCGGVENWFNYSTNGAYRYRFYLTSGKVWDVKEIDEPTYKSFWNGEEYTVVGNGIMPVVTLKSNLVITGGYGTLENPYEVALLQ